MVVIGKNPFMAKNDVTFSMTPQAAQLLYLSLFLILIIKILESKR